MCKRGKDKCLIILDSKITYYIFTLENGTEPIHVHVAEKRPSKACAKFWLLENGTCKLAYNRADIPNKDLKKIEQFIELNFNVFCTKWKDFFQLSKIDFLTE